MSLNVAVLSRRASAYSTRRLVEAMTLRGHRVEVLDTLRFGLLVETGRPKLLYRDAPLGSFDAVIPRIGPSISQFGTAVVRQFEQTGVFSLNSAQAISTARDKLRTLQLLSRHSLGIPKTAFVSDRAGVKSAIEQVGGAPVVVKLVEGSQGTGVILADTSTIAESIVETLMLGRQNVVVQKFVEESRGRDVRALVVGDRVVAAMQRLAARDEYRSNVHRGGGTRPLSLDQTTEDAAIRAAQILGLRVAGVDLLESHDGPLISEVNASPGLEGIEAATGVDVADAIARHLEDQVFFPDLDLRQRLTVASGYGVMELVLQETSELRGHALGDLRDREVQILSLGRGLVELPNPRGDMVLQVGDRLLCFGRYQSLRELSVPRPSSERRGSGPGENAA